MLTFVSRLRATTSKTQYPIWPMYMAMMYMPIMRGEGEIEAGYIFDILPNEAIKRVVLGLLSVFTDPNIEWTYLCLGQ